MDPGIAELTELLRNARRAVVFTGAGISTESGIPDFRSPGGIWTKMMPVQFQDYVADPEARRVSWERRFEMEATWNAVSPNAGHLAVAELVRRGIVSAVITQNIDNLHQAAGVPESQVIELHGNTRYAKCLSCNARVEIADIRRHFDSHGEAPDCKFCGGIIKTATISFGQAMPEAEMARAQEASLAADFFLVGGLLAGGLSRGGLSADGQAGGRDLCHPQPGRNRARPLCGLGLAPGNRANFDPGR